jgi:hypothetical protein
MFGWFRDEADFCLTDESLQMRIVFSKPLVEDLYRHPTIKLFVFAR